MLRTLRARVGARLQPYRYASPQRRLRHYSDRHKEYFQNPTSHTVVEPTPPFQPGPPLPRRFLRSILWATLFGIAGAVAASGFETWTWMHACFEPGSETDVMYMEVIKRRLQDNSILQTLEADPEFEVYKEKHDSDPKGLVKHEDVYMRTAMGGSRGIQMRCFSNLKKLIWVFIIHIGEGAEGRPGIVHQGTLATVIEDSMDWLGQAMFPRGTALSCFTAGKKLEIIFTQPVRSGDVYTFWVIPALFLGRETVNEQILGPKLTEKELRTTLVGMLEKRESLPNEQYSPGENVVYAKSFVTYEFSDEQDRYRP